MRGNHKQKLLPRMRFPEFHNDGEWKKEKLAKFLVESRIEGSTGDTAKKITVKLWGKGVFAKEEPIKGSENTKYYKRRAGQFIYSKLDFLNQAFGIVPKELDGFESTVDLPCFDINDELNAIFLLEYVKRNDFYKKNGEIADGGRKAKRIQTDVFLSFPIILPAHNAEQQKIADCLSSLDDLLTAEVQKLDALKKYKKGLMQQLFPREDESIPRLRFPEFREADEWKIVPMGSLLKREPEYGVNAPAVSYSDDLPTYLRITDIDEDGSFLCKSKVSVDIVAKDAHYLEAGDIVLARTGASVGKSYRHRSEHGRLVFAGFLIRVRPEPKKIDPIFLSHFLNSQRYWQWVSVTSTRSGQPGINGTEYASLPVPVPPNGADNNRTLEQKHIADLLSSTDDLITAQSHKIDALKNHKKGLMQQLFPVLDEVSA